MLYMLMIIHHIFVVLSKLHICALKLFEQFSNYYMKKSSDKCHLILSSNDENKKIELNGEIINNTQIQKLLGVYIDYKLKFDKVGKKPHAVARVIKHMSTNQALMLQFSYGHSPGLVLVTKNIKKAEYLQYFFKKYIKLWTSLNCPCKLCKRQHFLCLNIFIHVIQIS